MKAGMQAEQTKAANADTTGQSFSSKFRSLVTAAELLALGGTGVVATSCTHTAELQTYRKDASGKIIEKSEIAGATLRYPGVAGLMAESTFRFENLYVTQFKAHLMQQARTLGVDHCVNRWMRSCPGLEGASDNLRLVDAQGKVESLFKFMVHEGVEAGKALALMHGLMNIPADNINVRQSQSIKGGGSVCPAPVKDIGTVIPGSESFF
jgi:hypothetical protein